MEAYISSTGKDFDILIPSFLRAEVLDVALRKIAQLKPEFLQKIIILHLEHDTRTSQLIQSYGQSLTIQAVSTKVVPPPGASRNRLIEQSSANWLCFLDDDVEVSDDYFTNAMQIIENEDAAVFGGPDQPNARNTFQKTLGIILSYPLLMGPTFKRHSRRTSVNRKASEIELTLCNLWINAKIFKEESLSFDEELKRCEENLLLDQIQQKGHSMAYFPQLFVYHLRRSNLFDIAEIQLRSGYFRGIELNLEGATFKSAFLIPLITGALIFLLPLLSPETFSSLVILHCGLNTILSLKTFLKVREPIAFVYSFILIALIHVMFSIGILIGWVKGKLSAS